MLETIAIEFRITIVRHKRLTQVDKDTSTSDSKAFANFADPSSPSRGMRRVLLLFGMGHLATTTMAPPGCCEAFIVVGMHGAGDAAFMGAPSAPCINANVGGRNVSACKRRAGVLKEST